MALTDIDSLKRSEDALNTSELKYRRLFESAKDGILILDAETGMVVDVNPFLIERLGLSREIFLGKQIWELGFFKNIVANQDRFKELQEKEYIRYEDLPLETADGRKIDVEFISNVYRVNNHRVIQCNIRDITARKQAEEALRRTAEELARSNQDLAQFANIASHDLQEPLRMIGGFLKLLNDRYAPQLDDKAREYIGFAVDGAGRMSQLINDLLAYSRVGRGGKGFAQTDMEVVLARSLENLRASIDEAQAAITHDPLPTVKVDGSLMSQLLQNLIGNAIKYRVKDAHPQIHVGARRDECGWAFWVRDNGIGIEPENHDRVFMIFQRLHTRQEYSGTGIGLAICKRIVEHHRGRIWLESEPGKGSTFHFTIPDRD